MKASLPGTQKGAVAIEFAAVFVIFFAVFYAVVSYSLPLLLLQSFNQATAQAVRLSVAIDPNSPGYTQNVPLQAAQFARNQLSWLPTAFKFQPGHVSATFTGGVLRVVISYPSANLQSVLPSLVLPGVGAVPQLPTNLTAQSSLQF